MFPASFITELPSTIRYSVSGQSNGPIIYIVLCFCPFAYCPLFLSIRILSFVSVHSHIVLCFCPFPYCPLFLSIRILSFVHNAIAILTVRMIALLLGAAIAAVVLPVFSSGTSYSNSLAANTSSFSASPHPFEDLVPQANYSCGSLMRWLGTEKHYSNDKKKALFALADEKDCSGPALTLRAVVFEGGGSFARATSTRQPCSVRDHKAVGMCLCDVR